MGGRNRLTRLAAMPGTNRIPPLLALVAAVAALSGCGSGDDIKGQIPATNADQLNAALDTVGSAVASNDCATASSGADGFIDAVNELPATAAPTSRRRCRKRERTSGRSSTTSARRPGRRGRAAPSPRQAHRLRPPRTARHRPRPTPRRHPPPRRPRPTRRETAIRAGTAAREETATAAVVVTAAVVTAAAVTAERVAARAAPVARR